jgi:hypothetical protein
MSTFKCPHCETENDTSYYPDHVNNAQDDKFWFDCECGARFQCFIDWEPMISPLKWTLYLPEPDPDRLREDRDERQRVEKMLGD